MPVGAHRDAASAAASAGSSVFPVPERPRAGRLSVGLARVARAPTVDSNPTRRVRVAVRGRSPAHLGATIVLRRRIESQATSRVTP